jgi:ArpU family phage transcriptional regulator
LKNNVEELELSDSIKEQAIGLLQARFDLKNKINLIKKKRAWASELSGVDYTREKVQEYGIADSTAEHAIGAIMQEVDILHIQYIVNNIEKAIEKLPEEEKKLIKLKYEENNIANDNYVMDNIYIGKTKYYEMKKRAIKRFALYIGLLSLDFDNSFVQFSENKYKEMEL